MSDDPNAAPYTLTDPKTGIQFQLQHFTFPEKTLPYPGGWLHPDRACQALYYYALLVMRTYLNERDDPHYEEEGNPGGHRWRELMRSLAVAYGTTPERMIKFWVNVDMQFTADKSEKVPKSDYYRQNEVPEVKSQ